MSTFSPISTTPSSGVFSGRQGIWVMLSAERATTVKRWSRVRGRLGAAEQGGQMRSVLCRARHDIDVWIVSARGGASDLRHVSPVLTLIYRADEATGQYTECAPGGLSRIRPPKQSRECDPSCIDTCRFLVDALRSPAGLGPRLRARTCIRGQSIYRHLNPFFRL